MTRVKICGVKRIEDALLAAELGADAIGLLVGRRHASTDFISPASAREIVLRLPPFVSPVLVTHVEDLDELRGLLDTLGVSTIQVHSQLSPDQIAVLRNEYPYLKVTKSYHVTDDASRAYGIAYRNAVDGFVLDTVNLASNQVGGTGKTHDWSISADIVTIYPDVPVILAGGLHPDNVAAAIAQVRPFGVDVNSGTKGPDGFKDPLKLKQFITRAKGHAGR